MTDRSYIVFDTETTGMEPETANLVEFAGVASNGHLEHSLCNPGHPIPAEAMGVHHILDWMVADAPMPEVVVTQAMHAFKRNGAIDDQTVFVAHNAEYDRKFLSKLHVSFNQFPWVCSYRCALHVWPDAPKHSNQVLRYWLKLDITPPGDLAPHRAAYDAYITKGIMERLLAERSMDELIHLTTAPVLLKKVGFGKHHDLEWSQVPKDYLQWVLRQPDMDADKRHTAAYYLRGGQGKLL
jgi:exodeoxyribonuclease X